MVSKYTLPHHQMPSLKFIRSIKKNQNALKKFAKLELKIYVETIFFRFSTQKMNDFKNVLIFNIVFSCCLPQLNEYWTQAHSAQKHLNNSLFGFQKIPLRLLCEQIRMCCYVNRKKNE